MRLCGVYRIRNLRNGRKYIGSSVNILRRFRNHKRMLEKECHTNGKLQRDWNKYGKKNFRFEIVKLCKRKQLIEAEQSYLPQAKTVEALDKGKYYNRNPIAGC